MCMLMHDRRHVEHAHAHGSQAAMESSSHLQVSVEGEGWRGHREHIRAVWRGTGDVLGGTGDA